MAEVKESGILIQDVETKNIMTKSTLPVGGYSVNPYVGCTHGCKYCYASFMKRFTGHTEPWGTFLDVKHWPAIKNPQKYKGQRVVIGSVTDGYLPQEAQFQNTRKLLEQLRGSEAEILICTKSDLVIRDIDLLKKLGKVTVSWSINTLDKGFKNIFTHFDRDYIPIITHRDSEHLILLINRQMEINVCPGIFQCISKQITENFGQSLFVNRSQQFFLWNFYFKFNSPLLCQSGEILINRVDDSTDIIFFRIQFKTFIFRFTEIK